MSNIETEWIGTGRNPKKRKRYLLLDAPDTAALATLSAEWRQLLTQCVKKGQHSRWQSWQKIAGVSGKTLLDQLLAWLLKHGWVCVYEENHSSDWWPYKLEILHFVSLQTALGLKVVDAQKQILLKHLDNLQEESFQVALENLAQMPISRAIGRAELLLKLQQWQLEGRSGTYRDFSLYARDSTKALSSAEWQWLDTHCDLARYQIERHTCLLLLAADIEFSSAQGLLDLNACPDFAALTPDTVKQFVSASGNINTWILVENRTSFERVARNRQADEGVIWLPGFPPTWWKEAVSYLVKLLPAPAKIACDPDPAGIAIALSVMELWRLHKLEAKPWKMGVVELNSLISKKSLTAFDQQWLARLLQQDMPAELQTLAQTMLALGLKGEQEGYL